jgi:hypothetical protein
MHERQLSDVVGDVLEDVDVDDRVQRSDERRSATSPKVAR